MKYKIIALSLIACAVFASQEWTPEREKIEEQKRMDGLAELGLPLPGSGIKLVPRSMLGLSERQLREGEKADEQRHDLGYAIVENDRAKELLNFKNYAKKQFRLYSDHSRDSDTHLRQNIKDLKLAFKFKGVPATGSLISERIKILGVAPQGGFHKEKGGWSGAAQFFESKHGICSYAVMDVKASNTAAELAIEDVTYIVNGKAAILLVDGKPNNGFVYRIEWYDDEEFHELECANINYSTEITESVIQLANNIDSYKS